MVMTSDQISQMAGSFQAQNMSQMQHAAMISQQVGAGQSSGEAMMGKAVNFGSSVGAPMAAGAMALAGADPFSMGIRGAMAGGARAGMMGAVGGGMMGAGMVAAPLMAAQYAGSQMMTGMQQQQQLNAGLRQQYSTAGAHGRGFSSDQMGNIGQFMRAQTQQQGPGGEFTSMDELGRMAQQMGQMGGGQNIRSVKDFTEKFRTMMKEVKEVAQSFHTSLEEAQQVVGGMRSSGVFSNQGQVAQQIRGYSMAGGLATSEVTSMMNVGSQISRSIGGRGRAGAMGGMQAIGQVGIAQKTGIMSEEDIYNTTGLTGAEGRQAMATNMLSQSARFLKGGLGRRFLASVAGKDGQLDEGSVEAYMHGGDIGTDETMRMAGSNLKKVGRANFIRNEGKLRGSALEKFGGLAPAMVMKGWLEQRGLDMNDDRSMIFAQRRLGMGNDEMEQMMKLVKNLPQLMQEKEMSGHREKRQGGIEKQQANTGLSGIKKKFETARNDINSRLQQAGAEFYSEGSNMLERWANEITGNFMTEMSENLEPAIQEILKAGGGAEAALSSRFGMGKGQLNQKLARGFSKDAFGGGGSSSVGSLESARRAGDITRMQNSGYNITAGSDKSFEKQMGNIRGIEASFREGNEAVSGIGGDNAEFLREQVAMRGMRSGMQGQTDFGAMLERSTDKRMQRLALQYGQADSKQRAGIMGQVMREAGMGGMGEASAISSEAQAIVGQGGFRTESDRNEALGDYMLGQSGQNAAFRNEKVAFGKTRGELIEKGAGGLGRLGAGLLGGPLGVLGEALGITKSVGESVGKSVRGSYEESAGGISRGVRQAAGDYTMSGEGQARMRGLIGGDAKAKDDTIRRMGELQRRTVEAQKAGGKISDGEQGELESLKSMTIAADFNSLAKEHGKEEALSMLAEKHGLSADEVERRAGGPMAALSRDRDTARKELMTRAQEHGAQRANMFRKAGIMKGGKISAAAVGQFGQIGASEQVDVTKGSAGRALAKSGGADKAALSGDTLVMTTGQQFIAGLVGSANALEKINKYSADDPRNSELMEEHLSSRRAGFDALGRMDDKALGQAGKAMRDMGDLGTSGMIAEQQGLRRKLGRAGGGMRGSIVAAEALGSGLSRKKLASLGGDIDATTNAITQSMLGSQAGTDQGKAFQTDLKKALEAQAAGKTKESAKAIQDLRGRDVVGTARKEKQDKAAEDDPSFRALGKIEAAMKKVGSDVAKSLVGSTLIVNVENIKDLKPEKSK